MAIKNKILIRNKLLSWFSRILISSLIVCGSLITGIVSLQYVYRHSVDKFLLKSNNAELIEDILVIRTGKDWVSTSGNNKEIYQPLLAQELGAYQSHRYIGWYANYQEWQKGLSLPFTLSYEVTYANAVINENFYFKGGMPAHLQAREVTLPSF